MLSFLWTVIIGLIAGVIAKLVMPGEKEPQGFVPTVLGVAGALVGTYLGKSLGSVPTEPSQHG